MLDQFNSYLLAVAEHARRLSYPLPLTREKLELEGTVEDLFSFADGMVYFTVGYFEQTHSDFMSRKKEWEQVATRLGEARAARKPDQARIEKLEALEAERRWARDEQMLKLHIARSMEEALRPVRKMVAALEAGEDYRLPALIAWGETYRNWIFSVVAQNRGRGFYFDRELEE